MEKNSSSERRTTSRVMGVIKVMRDWREKCPKSRLETGLMNMHCLDQPVLVVIVKRRRIFLKCCVISGWMFLRWEKTNGYNVPSVANCAYVGWHMEIHAFQPNFLLSLCPPTRTLSSLHREEGGECKTVTAKICAAFPENMEQWFCHLQSSTYDPLVNKKKQKKNMGCVEDRTPSMWN